MLSNQKTNPITCPNCGAPHHFVVPTGAVQIKCQYCGSTFAVPPALDKDITRCANHPELLSIGLCNDCGRNFCGDCLYLFDFRSEYSQATLFLCPDCLESRY